MIPGTSGNSYEIVQAPGYVAIRYERMNDVRVIPLDGRPHANIRVRAHLGDARGRFQGDTLIVETTNFRDQSAYRDANPDRLRLVERFTPQPDGMLEWSVTVDDPSTWTRRGRSRSSSRQIPKNGSWSMRAMRETELWRTR